MGEAKDKIIIIDSYADKTVLDIISKLKVKVILITRKHSNLSELDISKYYKQFNNLTVIYDSIVYHLGTSKNHAGSKTFSINILTDEFVIKSLIDKILTIV